MTEATSFDLGNWSPVSLSELNRRAALLDREENKYVVSAAELQRVLDDLRDDFDVLTIDGRHSFSYDTVYFDTPDLLCYRQHAQGRRLRMKVRSRHYVDSDLHFFEVKLKGTRGRTIKLRMPYPAESHGTLTGDADRFLRSAVADVYGAPLPARFSPALAMTYRRLTLVGRQQSERVTIDYTLGFRTLRVTQDAPPSTVIVEVKSPDGRGIADERFRAHHVRPQSCSKYCVGVGLTTPGIQHNAFNNTLRTHFEWKGPTNMLSGQEIHEIQARVVGQLEHRCREFPRSIIENVVAEELAGFRDATVGGFLDILVSRAAMRRLHGT